MHVEESLKHTKWECKYHVVFIPKYRRKAFYYKLREHLGEVFRELARRRESQIAEGHLMADHVHMLISIPPKYSVAQVMGYLKGKSAIHIAGGSIKGDDGALWGSSSGRGATGYQPSVEMRRRCATTSKNSPRPTSASINSRCSEAKAAWSGSKTKPL